MAFELISPFSPTGDQPQAIKEIVGNVKAGERGQVLLGVTGSGKTFTMANAIAQLDRPVLVLTHIKTLTPHLYGFLLYTSSSAHVRLCPFLVALLTSLSYTYFLLLVLSLQLF